MRPADIARAWRTQAGVAVFSAQLFSGTSLTVHPFHDGGGFLYVVWRSDREITTPAEDGVASGGRCRARTKNAAIAEAVKRFTREEAADG